MAETKLRNAVERNLEKLLLEFADAEMPGIPKHVRLRNALLAAIRKGYFRPGEQLPPESELCKAVGLSIGTVRRALNGLATEHALTREQGRGTFIASADLSPGDLWQFRFVRRCGDAPLPVRVDVVARRLVRERGAWADALGFDDKGYCELTREVTVDGSFRCLGRFYVRVSRFPKIMKMELSEIRGNLKRVLAEEFNAPTRSLEQFIRPCVFEDDVCSALKIKRGSAGMVINTIGQSFGQEAITFQSLWVPAAEYLLEVSAIPRTPVAARAPYAAPSAA